MNGDTSDIIIKGLTEAEAEEFVYWFSEDGLTDLRNWLSEASEKEDNKDKTIRKGISINEDLSFPTTPEDSTRNPPTEKVHNIYME